MGDRPDDLVPPLTPQSGDPTVIRGGKGTVVEWNPLTAENVVRFRGANLVNLPIQASSTEVLLIKPGDEVILHILGGGGFSTVYIVGRITQPGTAQAASFMDLFGFETASEATEGAALSTYLDLGDLQAPANPGPSVTVTVGQSGRALMLVQAEIVSSRDTEGFSGGNIGIQLSGANTLAASDQIGWFWTKFQNHTTPAFEAWAATGSHFYTGLNPGSTTFTMKYGRRLDNPDTTMKNRTIMVLPF